LPSYPTVPFSDGSTSPLRWKKKEKVGKSKESVWNAHRYLNQIVCGFSGVELPYLGF
jgi:hypothetical protein